MRKTRTHPKHPNHHPPQNGNSGVRNKRSEVAIDVDDALIQEPRDDAFEGPSRDQKTSPKKVKPGR